MIFLSKKYILPCAGYDRSGGKVSKIAVDILQSLDSSSIIGSIGALAAERPGEIKDLRSSAVVSIDGCSVKCASKMVEKHSAREFEAVEVTAIVDSTDNEDEKAKVVVDMVQQLWATANTAPPKTIEPESLENDFLTEMIDKFILRVKKGLFYSDNDFWARQEEDLVRVGLTDLLQQMISDVFFVELTDVGHHVEFGDELGSFESTKIAMEIISPLSGTVVETNTNLEDSPELLNEDPYGAGWLYVMRPDDISELDLLKSADEYMTYGVEKAKHELGKKVSE